MTRSHKVLGFLLVAVFGIYGCAKGPTGVPAGDRAGLEAKVQRLEEDVKAAAAAREAFRQKAVAAEHELVARQKQYEQQRDVMSAQLKARTAERDSLQAQHVGFIKTLREQLDKAESAMNGGPGSGALVGTTAAGGGGN
jgi:multidrug efflux pump subunit AcrA (membrane-fusion protein)